MMGIVRIRNKKELEGLGIISWKPVDYYNEHFYLAQFNEDLELEFPEKLLIDEDQIVRLRTNDGRETYARASRSQFDDEKGMDRTCKFEYVPCREEGLTDRKIIGDIATQKNQVLWGCGLNLDYLEVFVPWGEE